MVYKPKDTLSFGGPSPSERQTFGEHACHPEPFASLKGKLREGSGSPGAEILRSAQDDSPDPLQSASGKPYLQASL